jgi:hypothetical protein
MNGVRVCVRERAKEMGRGRGDSPYDGRVCERDGDRVCVCVLCVFTISLVRKKSVFTNLYALNAAPGPRRGLCGPWTPAYFS